MGIEQINAAVLAGSIEGLLSRTGGDLDAFERGYLLVIVRRLREEGDSVVAGMSSREVRYFHDILLKAHQSGLIDDDSIIAQELGLFRTQNEAQRSLLMRQFEERRRALEEIARDTSRGNSNHTALATVDEERESRLSPREAAVYHLKRHLIAMLYRDSFSSQNAWRKYQRACDHLNERQTGYLKILAIHQLMEELPNHLSDPGDLLNNPEIKREERLRDFVGYARALARFTEAQARFLAESLEHLPDPEFEIRRR